MKKLLKLVPVAFFGVLIAATSCSDNEENEKVNNSTYTQAKSQLYEIHYESTIVDLAEIASTYQINVDVPEERYHFTFKTNFEIPTYLKNKELELINYLEANKFQINGIMEYYLNGEIVRVETIEEGESVAVNCINPHDGHCDDDYPGRGNCSIEGIRQCTRHAIYEEMNTIEKILCAFAGMGCIEKEMAMCAAENCFGA